MPLYMHPDAVGVNVVELYPEIFSKYEPIRFQFPRYSEFIASSQFLFGSKKNQNLSMLFSSVQNVYDEKHQSFYDFISNKKEHKYNNLLNIQSGDEFLKKLNELWGEYTQKHGMRKAIHRFYREWLSREEKGVITSKIAIDAQYKRKKRFDLDESLSLRLDILLDWRHKFSHRARYTPLSDGKKYREHSITYKNKEYIFLNRLSFEEFYELTRKGMARFWLKEYENYLKKGGAEEIDKIVQDITGQIKELNKRSETS